ncbi:hypothetical protein JD76_04732 [Micromonospora endolithica]|nr:hypothetical protein JD76_04732 [Micromonospora endolithica]
MGRATHTGSVLTPRVPVAATQPDGERNGRQRARATTATTESGDLARASSEALVGPARSGRRRRAGHPRVRRTGPARHRSGHRRTAGRRRFAEPARGADLPRWHAGLPRWHADRPRCTHHAGRRGGQRTAGRPDLRGRGAGGAARRRPAQAAPATHRGRGPAHRRRAGPGAGPGRPGPSAADRRRHRRRGDQGRRRVAARRLRHRPARPQPARPDHPGRADRGRRHHRREAAGDPGPHRRAVRPAGAGGRRGPDEEGPRRLHRRGAGTAGRGGEARPAAQGQRRAADRPGAPAGGRRATAGRGSGGQRDRQRPGRAPHRAGRGQVREGAARRSLPVGRRGSGPLRLLRPDLGRVPLGGLRRPAPGVPRPVLRDPLPHRALLRATPG